MLDAVGIYTLFACLIAMLALLRDETIVEKSLWEQFILFSTSPLIVIREIYFTVKGGRNV